MTPIDTLVGANINHLRKQRGFTQEHIAHYLDIDQTLVSKIENGQRPIGVSALEKLCDLFFCSLDTLVGENAALSPQKAVAFRSGGFSAEDLPALAAIGRITRNLEDMAALEKRASDES